jgi:hypothetical protein
MKPVEKAWGIEEKSRLLARTIRSTRRQAIGDFIQDTSQEYWDLYRKIGKLRAVKLRITEEDDRDKVPGVAVCK